MRLHVSARSSAHLYMQISIRSLDMYLVHRQLSSMHSLDHSQAAVTSASASTATPHPIQSAVLAMCQAIIPPSSSFSEDSYDWFLRLTGQAQPVIVAPLPRSQTSPVSSRRAVRIQIINKHDDIALPPATSLPMTPPPLSSSLSTSASSIIVDESTPTLSDYLTDDGAMFSLPTDTTDPPGLTALMNASLGKFTSFASDRRSSLPPFRIRNIPRVVDASFH